jgi:hypothetical protein
VFILTQDISNLMVMMDRWTVVNAAVCAAAVIGAAMTFRRRENKDQEDEDRGYRRGESRRSLQN